LPDNDSKFIFSVTVKLMHKHEAKIEVRVSLVSVSTSKSKKYGCLKGINSIPDEDESSKIAIEELKFKVIDYQLVSDNEYEIQRAVLNSKGEIVVVIGGTGITPKDVTVEAIKPLIKKELEGFGEVFRYESYKEVGVNAILSRAFAGILSNRKVIFCLPGSKNAVRLGIGIINKIAVHVVSHALGLR